MKIMLLNGSPKSNNSASEIIINGLRQRLGTTNEYVLLNAMKTNKAEFIEKTNGINAIVIVFPLYVDGIPSHLLRLLYDVKNEIGCANNQLIIYAIVNNGFYEGIQNSIALEMIQNFCVSANLKWGQGLGVGAGGMSSAAPIGQGPMKNLGLALDKISANIKNSATDDNFFIEPNFPKFLYKISAHFGWRRQAKDNGIKHKDIYSKR